MKEEKKIIVIYIGVAGIRSEDIETFVRKVTSKIIPTTVDGEIIIIPVQSANTKIECINPVFITEQELIEKHKNLMNELHVQLEHQISILKNEENEKKN